jgi:hypothetical protein
MRKFIVTFDETEDEENISIVEGDECEITNGILRIGYFRADMNYVVGIYEQTVEGWAKSNSVGGSE